MNCPPRKSDPEVFPQKSPDIPKRFNPEINPDRSKPETYPEPSPFVPPSQPPHEVPFPGISEK